MMIKRFLTILCLLATMLSGAVVAQTASPPPAAQPGRSPFGAGGSSERGLVAGRPAAPAAQPSGPIDRAWLWVLGKQAEINRALSQAVLRLKTEGVVLSTLVLASLSFAYGVLHAAGPGHGKAIISSYVLANERTVRRGIYLSFLAAIVQALMAIAMVGVLAVLLKATGMQMRRAEAWLETASWGLVALVGGWLLYRKVSQLVAERAVVGSVAAGHRASDPHGHHHHHHGHAHHDHAHVDRGHGTHAHGADGLHSHVHHAGCGHDHHGHGHAHGDPCCDHAHMPDPRQLEGELSWGKALAIVMAVGIRPCTGAVVVLVFALSQGLFWAGVFATFAMALGTAITVSALAALAVGSRGLAERLGGGNSRWTGMIGAIAGIGGSAAVMLLGVAFFFASLNGSGPL